jgi:DNA-binding NarL/FixJ family response regulator
MRPEFLVVEDERQVAQSLARILRELGPTTIASCVDDALEVVHRSWSGLIIDIQLPDGTGFDVLESAREHSRTTPAIVVSGYMRREYINRAARLDAMFVCKPCGRDELSPFMHRALLRCSDWDRLSAFCASAARGWQLSSREAQLVASFVAGENRESFVARTGMSLNTYKSHVKSLLRKAGHTSLSTLALEVLRAEAVTRSE